jgi:predicted phage terminase large subunit-like protein
VQNLIFFPEGWEHRWPEFYNQVRNYLKAGKNAHDDAPDALTGIVEHYRTEKANDNVYDIYADVDI